MRGAKNMNSENCGLASTPKKVGEVELQFQYCDKVRNQLGEAITALSDRLSPVLRQQNQSEVGGCEKEPLLTLPLTLIAENIKGNGKEMEFFVSRIKDILERLEI